MLKQRRREHVEVVGSRKIQYRAAAENEAERNSGGSFLPGGCYSLAMKACREGDRLAEKANDHSRAFDGLMDVVAMRAAREGSLAGFDGRVIYVRSAGEDAW